MQNSIRSFSKIGVYVDVANIYMSGGNRMQYDVLREFACRDGSELIRLNAYTSYDPDLARKDPAYKSGVEKFYSVLRGFGFKVIIKEVTWYQNEQGERYGKANADLDLAVDLLLQAEKLEKILLLSGDGDFSRVIRAVQNKGCRVEVVALDNVSAHLRREADVFISGYLIPNLVPTAAEPDSPPWGEPGSTVRGVCYFHKHDYGFMRYLRCQTPDIWITDTKRSDSPYGSVYFNDANLPEGVDVSALPSYNYIFEFDLTKSSHPKGKLEAVDIKYISRLSE